MLRALECQAPPLPHLSDTSGTHLVLGPGLGERAAMGVPLALPRPSAVCLFVCPVRYLPAGLLCPRRLRGAKSASAGPQPRAPFSSWLCLSCALQDPLVWAAPRTVRGGGGRHISWPGSHPPLVGSLNCLYGGVPVLNFYIPRVLGFVVYMYLQLVAFWEGRWGNVMLWPARGLSPVALGGGWGGGSTTPPHPGPPP